MSTLSSPRPSIASSRGHSPGPASSRPSLDALNTNIAGGLSAASTPSTARAISPNPIAGRRNRSALRDYYKLKPPWTGTELDNADFDPQRYVDQLLSTSSLSTILKAENTLVGDVRTLDGERKALVYDNYSKLIRAVETIGKMRQSMDERGAPLTMTKTLGPAISFVAETAGSLIKEGEEHRRRIKEERSQRPAPPHNKNEKETVQWVLASPQRLEKYISEDKRDDALKDWDEVKKLLDAWGEVKGVAEIREACEKVMNTDSNDD
ncbi:Vacuolar protein sorting-associated protein 51 [Penicillium waksmanii]|uniref:Vacuolar protein sorting-associated protein 51 n=1 Tax=Penicillium waksmanii TaxID=69791 RepID=UPI002548D186|nr:Vacuolar protein sorting-associated protein 51 [Penicillium waksmanii]KAJ5965521.1 Vacuolar protein sorting-associated protein 51 [Penicillium waksmanii]